MKFEFPNKDLMTIFQVEDESIKQDIWKMYFDGASNVLGHGIGTILIFLEGEYCPFTSRLNLTIRIMWQNMKHALWAYKQP